MSGASTPNNAQHPAAEPAPRSELARLVEALLMMTDSPLSEAELARYCRVSATEIRSCCEYLASEYAQAHHGAGRGFVLRRTGAGWRIYSHPDFHTEIAEFLTHGQTARLSQAALETLAVVAYRQPISRSQIAAIRGVNTDSVVKTLCLRGLIRECGQDDTTGAQLYETTEVFLETMGIDGLAELPPLSAHLPDVDALDQLLDNPELP